MMTNRFEMPAVVDAMSASMMKKELALTAADSTALSFDASHVQYIASAGLRLMQELERSGITVRVYSASGDVRELFDAAGLSALLARETRIDRAVSLLRSLFIRTASAHAAQPVHA